MIFSIAPNPANFSSLCDDTVNSDVTFTFALEGPLVVNGILAWVKGGRVDQATGGALQY